MLSALEHMVAIAAGYSNLELDLETGERSRRDVHAEELLLRLLSIKTRTSDEGCGGFDESCGCRK